MTRINKDKTYGGELLHTPKSIFPEVGEYWTIALPTPGTSGNASPSNAVPFLEDKITTFLKLEFIIPDQISLYVSNFIEEFTSTSWDREHLFYRGSSTLQRGYYFYSNGTTEIEDDQLLLNQIEGVWQEGAKWEVIITQEMVDRYFEQFTDPGYDQLISNSQDWNTSWSLEDLTELPTNGVIWKVESTFGTDSPFDNIDLSQFDGLGRLQFRYIETLENIWTVEVRRFSFNSITNLNFDETITEDDFNIVASIFNILEIGKLIKYGEDIYNTTEQYGTSTYIDVSAAIRETGLGKYRHVTLPTSLFANWLTENENNILEVLQVNETLIGTVLVTTITYIAKIEAFIRVVETTEDPDSGAEE